jgi:hypothetical protein
MAGATIHFTLDRTEPFTSSPVYSHPIGLWSIIGKTKTIKAIAVKAGSTNSSVVTQIVGVYSMPPLKTGSGAISGYTLVANEDDRTHGVNRGYTDNGNGIVTDTAIGLVWQK